MKNSIISNRLNIIDLIAILIVIGIVSSSYSNDMSQFVLLETIMPMVIAYSMVRILFQIASKMTELLMIFLSIACFVEVCIGLSQVFGWSDSDNNFFLLTGSFANPGPYGGFLAICVSVLLTYSYKCKESKTNNLVSKISYWVITSIAAMAIIMLPSTQSRSSIFALGCSFLVFVMKTSSLKMSIKPILKKYGPFILVGMLLLSTGAYLLKRTSADGRLFIDKICINAMIANGWKGIGIGHFGGAYGDTQAKYFERQIVNHKSDDLDWTAFNEHERLLAECPDNAFNEYLFLGVELGPMCMFILIGIIAYAIVQSFKRNTIWCYGLITFFVFAFFSYPLHVFEFQILFSTLIASCVSDLKSDECFKKKVIEIIILTLSSVVLCITRTMKKSAMDEYNHSKAVWKKVELWHKLEYYDYIVNDCESIYPYMKNDYHFLFAYGQSLNKTGNYTKSDSILKMGTKISSDPMFWNIMGNNSLALGHYREAEECYKHAFYMVPNRLYPLTLLAKLYHTECDTVRFLDMASKVETFVPKIQNAYAEHLRTEIREIYEGYNIEAIKRDE